MPDAPVPRKAVKENGRVLLFTTDTSANCQTAMEYLEKAEISFEQISAKQEIDLVKAYQVSLAPTLVVVDGVDYTKYEGIGAIIRYIRAK